jgi:3-deoxy-manno-octulosonate cytidylyltransferase (CMP-KDO synthetase)
MSDSTPGTAIVVPARLASSRFPEKLLHEVRGKPIVLWTADRVRSEAPEFPLWFAVGDERLRAVLEGAGYRTIMTDPAHACGTDRIAEANRTICAEFVINVQADEPLVTGEQIRQLDRLIRHADTVMATLTTPLADAAQLADPNVVKCVCDEAGRALYFSRAPIPYFRDTAGVLDPALSTEGVVLTHLGLYAYRRGFLEAFSHMPPGRLEGIEKLEMLRALERGHDITVGISRDALIGIDTRAQADAFEAAIGKGGPDRMGAPGRLANPA